MKINEFFTNLENEYSITPYEYCRIKDINYGTLKKYLAGQKPSLHVATAIVKATKGKVTLKDLGLDP